jgi:hypothetical protein
MFVPRKVEEKIRYLQRKYPSTEWSGVLFTTHEGSFEDSNLVITCQDIYPMDLGNATFTEYKMDETVAGYIADNIELFNCDIGLVHSHHVMSTTFSGTDTNTIKEEGSERNCFVSLIVNNTGTYNAAVTRKVQSKKTVTTEYQGLSYEFFGEGPVEVLSGDVSTTEEVETTAIEYFMLDVQVETVDNPLDYLDKRFVEIEEKKKGSEKKNLYVLSENDREDLFTWIPANKKNNSTDFYKQPTLFDKKTMDDLVDTDKWHPDPTIIHHLIVQMVTSSLIVSAEINLKQWIVKHMKRKYDEIFRDKEEFESWADSMVEFIVNHYEDSNVPVELYDAWDEYIAKIASALLDELDEYPTNEYMEIYKELLMHRAYE